MRCHWLAVPGAALLLSGSMARPVSAQSGRPPGYEPEVAIGIMVPAGSGLRSFQPGPTVRVGVVTHWPEGGGSAFRLDVEGYRLRDRTVSSTRESVTGIGVGYSWLGVAPAAPWRPYLVAGLGLQLVLQSGGDGYPALAGVVRAGVGVRGALRGVDVQMEAAGVGFIRAIGETRMFPLTIVLRF